MKRLIFLLFFLFPTFSFSQNVTVTVTLNATEGGVHSFMNVTLIDTISKASYSGKTDASGKAIIAVPPNAIYEMKIPNYTATKFVRVPNAPGATMSSTLFYSRNMVAQEKDFAMTETEKTEVDNFANSLPDTTRFTGTDPFVNYSETFYSSLELQLSDFNNGPLAGETVTLIGRKRHKAFKGVTNANGKLMLYLPKGESYDLSFFYHKNFESTECKYSKGISEIQWSFEYIGTKKFEQNKKDEAARQAAEAIAAANRIANVPHPAYADNDVAKVFDKNQFKNPLIVCDASAGMEMILDELQLWFAKNEKSNPNSQFVFFNDGNQKQTADKSIGTTGGFYYTPALPLDKLTVYINMVFTKSNDEDEPDNYVEALINAVKMAKQPYGDIVLIVDNHATVRDMELLPQFNHPVHVVVFCSIKGGCDHSFCQPDYLKIAWKTKGTLHINGTDYNEISTMKSGDALTIGPGTFKLVNGEFFQAN